MTRDAAIYFRGSGASTVIRGVTLCSAQDAARWFRRGFLIASAKSRGVIVQTLDASRARVTITGRMPVQLTIVALARSAFFMRGFHGDSGKPTDSSDVKDFLTLGGRLEGDENHIVWLPPASCVHAVHGVYG